MRSFAVPSGVIAPAVLITPGVLVATGLATAPDTLVAPAAAVAAPAFAPVAARASAPAAAVAAAGPKFDEELAITGRANHRRPVPGETQTVRWVLHNLGSHTIERARLDTAVPRGWVLKDANGCEAEGRVLHCSRGPLRSGARATIRVRMNVPRHPRLGRVWVWASTRFQAGGPDRRGPDAALRLVVVRHR
ncbi:hypothetical protein J4573_39910 [Actinomadura barringtoniae]|uniref:DUF11 domain-containing protein n=1 Tax=Actinomadura barringtoniae TaxID=1427535 RepID=A0A939PJA1_9ACTN|nr:hypothetical protein [Actinomadura barringtoniae]MBO2453317.1 hypothetical protein [Actinomadura barringtoniae]